MILFALLALTIGQTPAKCEGLPPGKHANLERMTAGMNLTCEQQLRIEPLLHDEESVSKPLLKFTSFSSDERGEFMNKVKIAARRQIREQVRADQQQWMDRDIQSVKSSGKKSGGDATAAAPGSFDDQETLSNAVMNYKALSAAEKKEMVLQVKRAARNDSALKLTPEQKKKLDEEMRQLSK
jgi:hypothetical protein